MKKILSIFVIIFVLAQLLSSCQKNDDYDTTYTENTSTSTADSELNKTSDGLSFELTDDNTSYAIIGIGSCADSTLVLPTEYNGKPITEIAKSAFASCDNLKKVIISDSISIIHDNAFNKCQNLSELTIGNNVITIGKNSFSQCYKLKNLTIPDSVVYIEECAFSGCNLEDVVLGNNVKIIGDDAFNAITTIKHINIPNSVEYIGDGFSNAGSNNVYKFNKYQNGLYLGNETNPYVVLFDVEDHDVDSFTIHQNTRFINSCALSDCDYITSLTLPNGILSLGSFSLPDNLKEVSIPETVNYIGEYVFSNLAITEIKIPKNITKISNYMFKETTLTTITIPDNVTEIGYGAFYDCEKLTTVTIGSGVKIIRNEAFAYCDYLHTFYYNGTEEEWDKVIKEDGWYTTECRVYFSQT